MIDVGDEHEREPLERAGDGDVAQADGGDGDADAEHDDPDVRVDAGEQLRGVGHAGEVGADVDGVRDEERDGARRAAPVAGTCARSAPAIPCPVTMPMRAHIVWTATMSGQVKSAVQSSAVPNCAPAIE